jgi:quercetin dioxygenase-like cupin family protein
MTTAIKPAFVLGPNEGKRLNILGHTATVKVSSQDAAGHYYTFDVVSPPGLGIPPHVHQHEDEVITVLEGDFEIWIDGKTHQASAGSLFHFPRLIPHGFTNIGNSMGRTLWTVIPGGNFEAFFEELNMLPPGPPDMAQVAAIFGKYHIDILPPPA